MKNFMLAGVPKLRAHPEKHEERKKDDLVQAAAPGWIISRLGQQ
jgi:hypothetical protein